MTLTDRIPLAALLSVSCHASAIKSCADRAANGEIFAYPTETIYGLGGRADRSDVERRIRDAKGRKKSSPFILVAPNTACLDYLGLQFTPNAAILAQTFWPGNLTMVLSARGVPEGVGVRITGHPFIATLCGMINVPLFSTSANRGDCPYVNDPDAIFAEFDGRIDFMVDAGVLPDSLPSTIVRVRADDGVEILREGSVSRERIRQALEETTR